MQTSKIEIGAIYAMKRGDGLIRFQVTEIVTRKTTDGPATNEIIGNIIEDDSRPGASRSDLKIDPANLLGPFEEQATLVERKRQEEAENKAKKLAAEKQARLDRLALYAFVGTEPPKDAAAYPQLFRTNLGTVYISGEGVRTIIARVHELDEGKKTPEALKTKGTFYTV